MYRHTKLRLKLDLRAELGSNDPASEVEEPASSSDFHLLHNLEAGAGANFTAYTLPDAIRPFYGDHPFSVNFYLRSRLRPRE